MREALFAAVLFLAQNLFYCLFLAVMAWIMYLGAWVSRDKINPPDPKSLFYKRDRTLQISLAFAVITTALLVLAIAYKFVLLPLIAYVGGGLGHAFSQLGQF